MLSFAPKHAFFFGKLPVACKASQANYRRPVCLKPWSLSFAKGPRQTIGAGLLVHGAFVVKLLNHYFGKPHLAFRDNCQGHTLLSYCCSYHVCTHNGALLLSSQDAFVRGCNGQRHGAWGSGRWAATRLDQWAVVHVEQWAVASLSGRGVSSGRHVVTLEQS